jgi:tetrahydromethanopterin S-methyltransferase subunit A
MAATDAEPTRMPPLAWPVVDGAYLVGDPTAPVAVCALTSGGLPGRLARLPGVAIAGTIQTANLGIQALVENVTANPAIRFLLLCGRDSPLFRPGQSLAALAEHGVDARRRIVGAAGYDPVLPGLPTSLVERFRGQVELVDHTDEQDLAALAATIRELAGRTPGPQHPPGPLPDGAALANGSRPVQLRPGGQRQPLRHDPAGYFVIGVDRRAGQLVVRHYTSTYTLAHVMRGRTAEPMLLGLLGAGLVSQLSHAGYLGVELAKAETALRVGLGYEQDRPLRPATGQATDQPPPSAPPSGGGERPAGMPPIRPSLTAARLATSPAEEPIQVTLEAGTADPGLVAGVLLEPDPTDPYRRYHRTTVSVRVRWTSGTQVVMGTAADVRPGALLRAHGPRRHRATPATTVRPAGGVAVEVDAEQLAILTGLATVSNPPAVDSEEPT